jgi:hypothetical protein
MGTNHRTQQSGPLDRRHSIVASVNWMAVNKKGCRFSWVRIHLGADSGKESLHNAAVSGVSQVTQAALKQDNAGLRSHAYPSGVHSHGYADLFLVLNRRVDLMNPLVIISRPTDCLCTTSAIFSAFTKSRSGFGSALASCRPFGSPDTGDLIRRKWRHGWRRGGWGEPTTILGYIAA